MDNAYINFHGMIAFNIIAFDSFDKNLSLWSSEFLKMFSLEEYYCHKYGAINLNVEYVLGHDNVHKENSSSFRFEVQRIEVKVTLPKNLAK